MSPSRDALRDDLRATINAAPELGEEERDSLADVFLDRLEESYRLVPRDQDSAEPHIPARARGEFPFLPFRSLVLLAVLAFGVVLLATSAFAAVHHPPIFLFVILLFLVLRFRPWGPRRRLSR